MPVAEEVHHIYPESEWALSRLTEDPGHRLFKAYGTQVPKADWNHPGTKQGIYMMGPGGEYLEGAHATSGSASRLVKRMERALERWDSIKKGKDYADQKVPVGSAIAPPDVANAALALRVSLRDLPRGEGDTSGRRRTQKDLKGQPWMKFTEWAWNQNWLTIDDPESLVPGLGDESSGQGGRAWDRIVRRALVDNVRGQNPVWKEDDVKTTELYMNVVRREKSGWLIEYKGSALLQDESKSFAPRLYGRAVWHPEEERFTSFRLVATGERAGAARFNQRAQDKAPAPMGVLLEFHSSRPLGETSR